MPLRSLPSCFSFRECPRGRAPRSAGSATGGGVLASYTACRRLQSVPPYHPPLFEPVFVAHAVVFAVAGCIAASSFPCRVIAPVIAGASAPACLSTSASAGPFAPTSAFASLARRPRFPVVG